jgi:hypothetical protein
MKYTWKDIVKIGDKVYAEEHEISGETEGGILSQHYKVDDFFLAVSKKYMVNIDDIKTYMFDNIEFNPTGLEFGATDCGCYIDGEPEWLLIEKEIMEESDEITKIIVPYGMAKKYKSSPEWAMFADYIEEAPKPKYILLQRIRFMLCRINSAIRKLFTRTNEDEEDFWI